EVNSLNTILAIAIMFICCNGKILIFTEINNSKRGYPTFWTAPSYNHFINTLFAGNQMIICLLFSSGRIILLHLKYEVVNLSS
ncbi:hypothetical protein OXV64_19100, partial [Bacteroides fragilis]|uniref:hypothetical protein n=1 Tax=Bacteroides hominis TaxID=2763023 RepID=UPI00228EA963|nr:hypothetical protein [Bacteroides fragilis]